MPAKFVTPVGRIVWGHPSRPTIKKDQHTKQPIIRDGEQVQQWAFGLAIPRADFVAQVWPHMANEAATLFPNGVPTNFSWKYKDGDGVDAKGQPFNKREGYAGHIVLTINTEAYAPPVYKQENGAYRQMEAQELKCGDYVAVNLTLIANKPASHTHTPGLYVNPNGIVHVAYGQEIVTSGANPDELFAGAQFAIPQGGSVTPVMGAAPLPSGMVAPAPTGYAPAPQQPVQHAPTATLPPPAHDFVHNAGAPQVNTAPTVTMPGMPVGR